jgi:hypothetical protein
MGGTGDAPKGAADDLEKPLRTSAKCDALMNQRRPILTPGTTPAFK